VVIVKGVKASVHSFVKIKLVVIVKGMKPNVNSFVQNILWYAGGLYWLVGGVNPLFFTFFWWALLAFWWPWWPHPGYSFAGSLLGSAFSHLISAWLLCRGWVSKP
jgi:hypothetical protein